MSAVHPTAIGIVGFKNTGKTTLVTKLVRGLVADGRRVGVIKHDAHGFFAHPVGTDTAAFVTAGATRTVIADMAGHVTLDSYEQTPATLDTLLARMTGMDVILVEGFKEVCIPKWVLMQRLCAGGDAYCVPEFACGQSFQRHVLGWVVPEPPLRVTGSELPVYHRDDTPALLRALERLLLEAL